MQIEQNPQQENGSSLAILSGSHEYFSLIHPGSRAVRDCLRAGHETSAAGAAVCRWGPQSRRRRCRRGWRRRPPPPRAPTSPATRHPPRSAARTTALGSGSGLWRRSGPRCVPPPPRGKRPGGEIEREDGFDAYGSWHMACWQRLDPAAAFQVAASVAGGVQILLQLALAILSPDCIFRPLDRPLDRPACGGVLEIHLHRVTGRATLLWLDVHCMTAESAMRGCLTWFCGGTDAKGQGRSEEAAGPCGAPGTEPRPQRLPGASPGMD